MPDSPLPDLAARLERSGATPADPFPTTRVTGSVPDDAAAPTRTPPDAAVPAAASGWEAGYELFEILGRGGMGVVYRARQKSLNRIVALKMILAGGHAGEELLARFRAEAEAVGRLQHPNIVQIHEVGEYDGRPCFALEFVDGGSLAQKLAGTPQPAQGTAALVAVLATAMHVAHQRGIVHRDLKPANVLLTPDGTPKIADFGLAKQLDDDGGQTQSGAIMGTPNYMAPEQAAGRNREIGPPADVYALGAILYEMLTGRPPFKGGTVWDTLEQVRYQEPVPPSRLQLKIPRDLETICLKCLQKEPARRYASALDLADDLRRFLDRQPIRARPVGRWERAAKWARRSPAAAALLAVSALALLSLASTAAVLYGARLREAEREASAARADLDQQKRLQEVEDRAGNLLVAAEEALRARTLPAAEAKLGRARDVIDQEPSLARLRPRAAALLDDLRRRQEDQRQYRRFQDLRDRALDLLHEPLTTGTFNRNETAAVARKALDLFGVAPESGLPVFRSAYFSPNEQAELTRGCYELLLVLAESEAQPLPGQSLAEQRAGVQQAIRLLERATRLGVRMAAHHLRHARYLDRLGATARAASERARAEHFEPSGKPGVLDYFLLGTERYRANNLGAAIEAFNAVLQLQPQHFWAQFYLAVCALRNQQAVEALNRLSACQTHRPDFIGTYLARGPLYAELGRRAQAAGQPAQAAREFWLAAERDFTRALELRPDDSARYTIHANRGVSYLWQGKLDEAEKDLREAIRLKPEHFNAHADLAEVYKRQKKVVEACERLDEAIRLQQGLAFLYRSRAQVHVQLEQPQDALDDLRQALQLAAGNALDAAGDHIQRGRILHHLRKYPEALEAYDEALKAFPDDRGLRKQPAEVLAVHHWRARTLLALDRPGEALKALNRHLKLGPDAAAYRDRGVLKEKQHADFKGAINDYTLALAPRPEAVTYICRGWARLRNQDPKLAALDFREASRLDARNPEAYLGHAHACLQRGDRRQAVADAGKAVQLELKGHQALYLAARVYLEVAASRDYRPGQPYDRTQNQQRGCKLLHEAVSSLPGRKERLDFWERIQKDRSLKAALRDVRSCPAFQQILDDFRLESPAP